MTALPPLDGRGAPLSNPFGFNWGPVRVERACTLPEGRRIVTVTSEYRALDIYVSATGRSLRVFSDGKEWTP